MTSIGNFIDTDGTNYAQMGSV